MNIEELKKELQEILINVKARIEFEQGFGVDAIKLSRKDINLSPWQNPSHAGTEGTCTPEKMAEKQPTENERERKTRLLEALRQEMLVCHKCPLFKTRKNLVFGTGNPMADLMFVGEAPGRDEDLQGEPFVGKAGQLLTKIIEAIGLRRSDVYIANVLKCRPPGNRNPLPEEIVLCLPYLIKQIDIIRPKVLCALGTFAAQTLLNTKATIGSLRGRFHEYKGIPMMVTFHPAYLLRNPAEKAKVWEDMKKVRDMLKDSQTNQ